MDKIVCDHIMAINLKGNYYKTTIRLLCYIVLNVGQLNIYVFIKQA